jgi:two-component system chemotaxis response regulator CheY
VSHTVLICDDASYMRTLLGDILQRGGLEVVGEATTGVEAVVKYKALRPDLVMMDLLMPEMGGIDAVRAIRTHDPHAKILVCSGLEQQGLKSEALSAGASDFIAKPFQPSGILEAVQRVLG